MEISSYLTELIRTRKEVGITGLGTIYKKKSPGRYDAQAHAFLPPSYTLEFTEEVKENNALAEFISKKKNISFDSSYYFVEQFAEELLRQLKDSREADLGELGRLSASDKGLTFSPSGATDLGFEFYGLPSFKDESAQGEESYAKEQEEHFHERLDLEDHNADLSDGTAEPDEQPVYDEISEIKHKKIPESPLFIETAENLEEDPADDTAIPENEIPATESRADHYWNFDEGHNFSQAGSADGPEEAEIEDKPKTPAYIKIIIAGAILLAIGAVVYFVKPGLFKGEAEKEQEQTKGLATNPGQLKIDSAAKADSILRAAQTAVVNPDSLKDTTAALNPALSTDTATTWEVIGASVINQKEADWFITQMKAIGITAKVIPKVPGKRRIKISIATFQDEASAMKGRKELVLKLKNPELYIYQNKHTNTQIK
ncbi:MAG TPA: hypothetical protein VK541_23570 [Pedobacter sp.]|uniref:HU domain-containing protein n=1 Tax=Pedobacter sp. TaxID=1411316 RepID=UPI002BB60263|nr:hypothetical protein [Pedobacter sp.]HMI05488.1 hypothetical protein [Pedobacter sp.]